MMLRSEKKNLFRQQMLLLSALWVAVITSALAVIYAAHDTRIQFNELEKLKAQENDLQVEWGQYLLEESAWASYGRIEKVATEKLLMQVPATKDIVMVNSAEAF